MLSQFDQAIKSYEQVLKIDKEHKKSQENKQWAQRQLKKQQEQNSSQVSEMDP